MHFAFLQTKVHAIERHRWAEALTDIGKRQNRHRFRRCNIFSSPGVHAWGSGEPKLSPKPPSGGFHHIAFRPIIFLAFKSLQQIRQGSAAMMFFLSINVARDLSELVLAQTEDPVAFLPSKFELGIDLFVYTKGSCAF